MSFGEIVSKYWFIAFLILVILSFIVVSVLLGISIKQDVAKEGWRGRGRGWGGRGWGRGWGGGYPYYFGGGGGVYPSIYPEYYPSYIPSAYGSLQDKQIATDDARVKCYNDCRTRGENNEVCIASCKSLIV